MKIYSTSRPINTIWFATVLRSLSGSIRNHVTADIMVKAFGITGLTEKTEVVEERFGGTLSRPFSSVRHRTVACAAGVDRIVMLLADQDNIREVVMFPMNQRAEDQMMNAPSEPLNEQLRELHLRVIPQD